MVHAQNSAPLRSTWKYTVLGATAASLLLGSTASAGWFKKKSKRFVHTDPVVWYEPGSSPYAFTPPRPQKPAGYLFDFRSPHPEFPLLGLSLDPDGDPFPDSRPWLPLIP